MIIAIDGGTTNTRLTLMDGGKIIKKYKLNVGARDKSLAEAVRGGLAEVMCPAVTRIAASGMITSDAGLFSLPHIAAPAGIDELRAGAVTISMPEISELPITFVPGVKVVENGETMDIMRGEETELMGILARLNLQSCTFILPGSHMKKVTVESGKIVDFSTSISGELSRAAAEHTILSRSLGDAFPRIPDLAWLARGRDTLNACGSLNAALFKLRVIATSHPEISPDALYAFLLGIVLSDDVNSLPKSHAPIFVGGSNPMRAAYLALIADAGFDARELPEELAENAAALGIWEIFSR